MAEQSVIAVYDSMAKAEHAVHELDASEFPIQQVSIVGQNLEGEKQVHGYITTGDVAEKGAVTGAWVGGIFGLLIGAAFIWVPGFGPLLVAGPLAAALLGGIEGTVLGAAGGGVLGALAGWNVEAEHIIKYEGHVKDGKMLVIAHGTFQEVLEARDALRSTDAESVELHVEKS
jgi:uncharacterized membrane protein